MKILISYRYYPHCKPDFNGSNPDSHMSAQIGYLRRFDEYDEKELTIAQFAELIGKGHCWQAMLSKPCRTFNNSDATETYALALDMDDVVNPPEYYIAQAESAGFKPNILYYSYSHGTEGHEGVYRFRLVWCFEKPMQKTEYLRTVKALMLFFEQADKSCKDAARLWCGTNKGVEVLEEEYTPLNAFAGIMILQKLDEGKRVRDVVQSHKSGVSEWVQEQLSDDEAYYVEYNGTWEENLKLTCPLWRMWCNGDYLNYNQRLMLWTNLKFLRYRDGSKSIIDTIWKYYKEETYKEHTLTKEQIAEKLRQYSLGAYRICNGYTMSVVEWLKAAEVVVPNNLHRVSLEELDKAMSTIPAHLSSPKTEYIVCPVGSGKTKYFIDWCSSDKKVIYAAPTYNLLWEVKGKLWDAKGIELQVPPKGTYTELQELIMQMGGKAENYNPQRAEIIRNIKNPHVKGIFGITHQLLLRLGNLDGCGLDAIIVDENIEQILTDEVIINKEQWKTVAAYCGLEVSTKLDEEAEKCFGELGSIVGERVDITPIQEMLKTFRIADYLNSGLPLIDGLLTLADGKWRARLYNLGTIRATRVSHLFDTTVPLKLMTATPLNNYLSLLIGNKIDEVVQTPLCENKGKIVQYLGVSGAKGKDMANVDELISYVKSKIPEEEREKAYVISFKKSIPQWIDAGFRTFEIQAEDGTYTPMHLANNAGIDALKGKTCIIAGKFDMPSEYYNNIYYDYIAPNDIQSPNRTLIKREINGQICKIHTFENAQMQEVQLERLQFFLSQASGRARALREQGAKVYVFANYPIPEADEYHFA